MKKILFYLLNIVNWLTGSLIMFLPKNQYSWMYEEMGDQHLVLPEDSDSLLVIYLLAIIIMALSFINLLFFNGITHWKIKTIVAIVPLLGVLVKLLVIDY